MVKEFLSQKGVAFKEVDVTKDQAAAQEIFTRTGQMGVPVITIDGKVIIGFNRAQIEQVLAEAQQTGRPALGAAIADASRMAAQQGSTATTGAYVGHIHPGSVAERIGLRPGDTITSLNGQPVSTAADLEKALAQLASGARLAFGIVRGTQTLTLEGTF